MFCVNCGNKVENKAAFCQSCGTKVDDLVKEVKKTTKEITDKKLSSNLEAPLFYSEEWERTNHFSLSSVPHFDILVTKNDFYLIQFPATHGRLIGFLVGLVILNIIGALVGLSLGSSHDKSKRKKYRAKWVDSEYKLMSDEYKDNVFIKIPKDQGKERILIEKKKLIVVMNNHEQIAIKKNKKEHERVIQFVNSYVLRTMR